MPHRARFCRRSGRGRRRHDGSRRITQVSGRVLLTATGACAVHCRYCFRRHFPYADANPAADRWQAALGYIAGDTSISEVILSGGDPLTLSDRRLGELTDALAAIPHVQRLRIHTRLPIVLPERVDDGLLGWLAGTCANPASWSCTSITRTNSTPRSKRRLRA